MGMVSMLDGFLMESVVASREKKEAMEKEIPDYSEEPTFKKFLFDVEAVESQAMGYMFIVLDKEVYHPGEEVTGVIFLESYRIFMQNKLAVQVYKQDTFPKRFQSQITTKDLKRSKSIDKVSQLRANTIKDFKYNPNSKIVEEDNEDEDEEEGVDMVKRVKPVDKLFQQPGGLASNNLQIPQSRSEFFGLNLKSNLTSIAEGNESKVESSVEQGSVNPDLQLKVPENIDDLADSVG
jgi:hypothetical protein